MSPVFSGMSTQPGTRRPVTTLARYAFIRTRSGSEPALPDRLKRRMTNCATGARLGFRDAQRFGDTRGTCVEQNCVRARVEILPAPRNVLTALFSCAAVATGRSTANRTDKQAAVLARLPYLAAAKFRRANEKTRQAKPACSQSHHAARLSLVAVGGKRFLEALTTTDV